MKEKNLFISRLINTNFKRIFLAMLIVLSISFYSKAQISKGTISTNLSFQYGNNKYTEHKYLNSDLPSVKHRQIKLLVDYYIMKNFAVGLGYGRISNHTISRDYAVNLILDERLKSNTAFLTAKYNYFFSEKFLFTGFIYGSYGKSNIDVAASILPNTSFDSGSRKDFITQVGFVGQVSYFPINWFSVNLNFFDIRYSNTKTDNFPENGSSFPTNEKSKLLDVNFFQNPTLGISFFFNRK